MAAPDNPSLSVVDASIVLSWLLPDETPTNENNQLLLDHRAGRIKLAAPELIRIEIANGLLAAILSHRISLQAAGEILAGFENLMFTMKIIWISGQKILETASRLGISGYDASYVALAAALDAPFYTLDKKLSRKISKFVAVGKLPSD